MIKVKYLILGAGPAGLTFANRLKEKGERSFLVLEKENVAGGLCRSEEVDGSALDIGGGHFLDVRIPEVSQFLFKFLPEKEWNRFERNSQIAIGNVQVHHPLEANVWQFPMEEQVEYLKSIAQAGCNREQPMPQKFIEWINWKLGDKIAEGYMIPYNKKMFGEDLEQLGTYWLEKLPNVSFEETLKSCLMHQPFGTQPGHANFYYPKRFGYGEVWRRMADELGQNIKYDINVRRLDLNKLCVTDSENEEYYADRIITTVPWESWSYIEGAGKKIVNAIQSLKHTAVTVEYCADDMQTDAHWIYYPDNELSFHRILVRHNFLPGSHGYWTETNTDRYKNLNAVFSHNNEYAYPLNTILKPQIMKSIKEKMEKMEVYPLGRWGNHEHLNSDVVVKQALDMVDKFEGQR